MVSSRRRGESAPVLSFHQILIHVHRNFNAETAQAWEDLSNMLNDTPRVVDIEENNDLLRNCNIAFQTRILELIYSNLAKCFRQKLSRSNRNAGNGNNDEKQTS